MVNTHVVSHLVRRGVEHVVSRQQYLEQLQQDAQAYENAGPEMEVSPSELLPMVITAIIGILVVCSVDYTIGQVMSTLTMIETPSATAIVESKQAPPPYTDEAPEKEPFLPEPTEDATEPSDLEITLVQHKPVTAKITTTIARLQQVGGFFSRWRGMRACVIYYALHGFLTNLISHLGGMGLAGALLTSIVTSVMLCRAHMVWTHSMIAAPQTGRSLFARAMAVKSTRALWLPAFVYAVAEQATVILPIGVALALGVVGPDAHENREIILQSGCPRAIMHLVLRTLAVPATYAFVGMALLFPASVTLTRIEALLLPEGEETIVPFDKAAIMADIDINARGGCSALFLQAWASFDRASSWRLVKLYVKLFFIQATVVLTTVHLIIFQLYVLGSERMAVFFRSAHAQVKLMMIEAHKARVDAALADN